MTLKRTLALTAAAATLASAAAAETRAYDVPGFSRIDVSAGLTLVYEAGAGQSVVAETDTGDFDKLSVAVEGDTLVLKRTGRDWNWGGNNRNRFTITVGAPAISGLEASSGSSATANGFAGSAIEIAANSGASLRASGIEGSEVSLDVSSGASLSAAGSCGTARLDASSGASLNAETLRCSAVIADASSGASIEAYASVSVDGEASSGGRVSVTGGATDVTVDKSSGGSVSVG